jgi:ABC-2 type transport system ATP-binding protein
VLSNINLSGDDGAVLGLLGPNGCGKSTLLRVLATLLPPDAGTLHLFGAPAFPATPALRRRIGFVPDAPAHVAELSGRANAQYFARASRIDTHTATHVTAALADRFELTPFLDRPAGSYSRGTGAKLALVEALAPAPALLLLDEADAALDARARSTLADVLRERSTAGACAVLASHDARFLQLVCTRVLFIHNGSVVLDDAPAALLARASGATEITIETDGAAPQPGALPDTLGIEYEPDTPGTIRVRTRAGSAALPQICAELVRAGAHFRAIRVHAPDLADVFAQVTGTRLAERSTP